MLGGQFVFAGSRAKHSGAGYGTTLGAEIPGRQGGIATVLVMLRTRASLLLGRCELMNPPDQARLVCVQDVATLQARRPCAYYYLRPGITRETKAETCVVQ